MLLRIAIKRLSGISSPPRTQKLLLGRLLNLGPDNFTLQFFATRLSVTLFVTPAYGERARKTFARGGTMAILVVFCFYPELGDHYSAHGLLALLSLYAPEYLKETRSAPSPANVIRITSVSMIILGCPSLILKAHPIAKYLSAVACVFFLLLRCSGLIDGKLIRQELDRVHKVRWQKLVFLYILTYAYAFSFISPPGVDAVRDDLTEFRHALCD